MDNISEAAEPDDTDSELEAEVVDAEALTVGGSGISACKFGHPTSAGTTVSVPVSMAVAPNERQAGVEGQMVGAPAGGLPPCSNLEGKTTDVGITVLVEKIARISWSEFA